MTQPVFDSAVTGGGTSITSPHTFNITIGNNANRCLTLFEMSSDTGIVITSITADSVSMGSPVDSDGFNNIIAFYQLKNPNIGTIPITVTFTGTVSGTDVLLFPTVCHYNVDQTTPITPSSITKSRGTAANPSHNVPSNTNSLVLSGCVDGSSLTKGAAFTFRAGSNVNSASSGGNAMLQEVAGATSVTANFTAGSDDYGLISFSLNGTSGGTVYTLTANAGSFALTGVNASLLKSKVINAQAGSFTFTGNNATLLKSKVINAQAGSFSLTGVNANIVYTPNSTVYTLTALPGSFTISGQNATLLKSKVLNCNAGSFAITGQNAFINKNRILTANAGAFAITGVNATLLKSNVINAQPGAFVLQGNIAVINYSGFIAPLQPPNIVSINVFGQQGVK
jgi:hypothetical protein